MHAQSSPRTTPVQKGSLVTRGRRRTYLTPRGTLSTPITGPWHNAGELQDSHDHLPVFNDAHLTPRTATPVWPAAIACRLSFAPRVGRPGHMEDAPACGIGAGDPLSAKFQHQNQLGHAEGAGKVDIGGLRVLGDRVAQEQSRHLRFEVLLPVGAGRGRACGRAGCRNFSRAALVGDTSRRTRDFRGRSTGGAGRLPGYGQGVLAAWTGATLAGQLVFD
jgi:hypothetical protein